MKEWNEGYMQILNCLPGRNPYIASDKKATKWMMGSMAAIKDMQSYKDDRSARYALTKLIENKYPAYIQKRLSGGWTLLQAKSIPSLDADEWKIKCNHSAGFSAYTELNGQRTFIGNYNSPKEALAVLKKNEKNLAKGLHIDPDVKTRHTKRPEVSYVIWGVSGCLKEWSEALYIKESAIKQRAKHNGRSIEREIRLRFMESIRSSMERVETSKDMLSFDVYSKFIWEYKDGKDIYPAAGPFTVSAPTEYWCAYIGMAKSTARGKAKKNGLILREYVINEVRKNYATKKI